MSYFLKEYGKKVKGFRELKGLSQEELAEMVDVSANTISIWETGKSFIEYPTLLRLCKALDVEEAQLFNFGTENCTSDQEQIVNISAKLSPAKQKQVLEIIKTFQSN